MDSQGKGKTVYTCEEVILKVGRWAEPMIL
jgi:hypothetical protein